MNRVEFSREAANILSMLQFKPEYAEFEQAAQYASEYGGEDPLKLMPTKFKRLFKGNNE